jgi:hypothetical protein
MNVPRSARSDSAQPSGPTARNPATHAGLGAFTCSRSSAGVLALAACHAGGRGFESRRSRLSKRLQNGMLCCLNRQSLRFSAWTFAARRHSFSRLLRLNWLQNEQFPAQESPIVLRPEPENRSREKHVPHWPCGRSPPGRFVRPGPREDPLPLEQDRQPLGVAVVSDRDVGPLGAVHASDGDRIRVVVSATGDVEQLLGTEGAVGSLVVETEPRRLCRGRSARSSSEPLTGPAGRGRAARRPWSRPPHRDGGRCRRSRRSAAPGVIHGGAGHCHCPVKRALCARRYRTQSWSSSRPHNGWRW